MKFIIKLFSNIVGPTAVMAAGVMGAGSVTAYILVGAWFRYDLLWVVLAVLPIFVIGIDSASRVGSLNPEKGMLTLIREHTHPGFAWVLLLVNIPLNILILMGQMSVMTSSFMSLIGIFPPEANASSQVTQNYLLLDVFLTITFSIAILWLILARGYERMQKYMSILMIMMFICFLVVALRGFSEIAEIIKGLVPYVPPDVPVPGTDDFRLPKNSIAAMAGSALAPAALLGMSYMSSDAKSNETTLKQDFRKSLINLGLIFGAYSLFIMIAGGYALYPLGNHLQIDTVHEASKVLASAFPEYIAFVGPSIFSAGLFFASVTTIILAAQLTAYFSLDMLNKSWSFSSENRAYHYLLVASVMVSALLAPFWQMPAMIKIILLVGFNVFVTPLVIIILIYMVNQTKIMKQYRAEWWRNLILFSGFTISIILAINEAPGLVKYVNTLVHG